MSKKYYALVSSLATQDMSPVKVLPASELYRLKPNLEARVFRPKHDSDFKKHEEYGRKTMIDGQCVMVRHIIFQLNVDYHVLDAQITSMKGSRKFTLPPRKSVSSTVEPACKYVFTGTTQRADAKQLKVAVSNAKSSSSDSILNAYKKQANEVQLAHPDETGSRSHNQLPVPNVKSQSSPDSALHAYKQQANEVQPHARPEVTDEGGQGDLHLQPWEAQFRVLKDMILDLKATITTNTKAGADSDIPSSNRKAVSRLAEMPSNLMSDDDEVVGEDEVKVGPNRVVKKDRLILVEKKRFLTARIEELLDVFYDNPGLASLSGTSHIPGVTLHKITDSEVTSLKKILEHMKWSYKVDVKETSIRDRIAKYTHSKRKAALGGHGGRKRQRVQHISSDSETD